MQKRIRNKSVTKTVVDLQNISYELRTPLNAILGFAQLLETDFSILTSTQRENVNQILKAGWFMLESVNKILDLTEKNPLSFHSDIELSHPQKLTSAIAHKSVLVSNIEDIFNAKILIVDDQEANVLLLEKILHEAGYTAITSTMNPYTVGVLHRKNNYDLILLDLQMPGLDGFHVMENLKKTECDGYLPVIVVSAHEKYRVRALEEGAKDFISKPFDLYEVLMRIYNMLQVRLLHKESKNYSLKLEKIVCDLRETELNLLSAEDILSKEKAVLSVNVVQLREANAMLVSDNIKAHTLTEETEKAKLKMTDLAQHDVLTGLPNRLLLNDRLEQMIILAGRQNNLFAVMFLDLDNFKLINDVHGHSVGDQVLQMVAKRLLACVRHSDTVCRQGGDEFVILLTDIEHPEYAIKGTKSVEKKILVALAKPYVIGELEIQTSASMGISMYPDNGLDGETLIRNADTAMYRAKESGHNSYQFFE